jgi:ubiquinone/menaquinone biosynthesis C-methylase UbiE
LTHRRRSSQRIAIVTAQDTASYESHVVPRYSALFGRILLDEVPSRARVQVLDVGCGSGYPALEVLKKIGEGGRVIAIDPDGTLIDVARRRALGDSGRRIFFKVESAEELSFSDDVFDIVIANLALEAFERPDLALGEIKRVLAPKGRLVLTHAMAGTFEEVLDMFREIALKHENTALAQRVERIAGNYPTPPMLEAIVANAGFEEVKVVVEEQRIPFPSPAEIFSDPMIAIVALPEWKWIAGTDEAGEETLAEASRSLETYFWRGPISLTVQIGLCTAKA